MVKILHEIGFAICFMVRNLVIGGVMGGIVSFCFIGMLTTYKAYKMDDQEVVCVEKVPGK